MRAATRHSEPTPVGIEPRMSPRGAAARRTRHVLYSILLYVPYCPQQAHSVRVRRMHAATPHSCIGSSIWSTGTWHQPYSLADATMRLLAADGLRAIWKRCSLGAAGDAQVHLDTRTQLQRDNGTLLSRRFLSARLLQSG